MVLVFTKNNCMQCKMVQKQLSEHKVKFDTINIDEHPEFIDTIKGHEFLTAPVILPNGKDNWGNAFAGFNVNELRKLYV